MMNMRISFFFFLSFVAIITPTSQCSLNSDDIWFWVELLKIIIGVFNSRLASDIPSLAWAVLALASACQDVVDRVDRLARDAANALVGHSVACDEDALAAAHSSAAVDCARCKAAVGQDCVVNRLVLAEALPVGIVANRLISLLIIISLRRKIHWWDIYLVWLGTTITFYVASTYDL